MPDAIFDDRRLADIYDPLDSDRSDLDAYVALVDEFGASTVLDVGCGTGTFACLLAQKGVEVIGVDPAAASLDVARRKPFSDRVRWLLGDPTMLPPLQVDLVTMTGNAAQVFLRDEEWTSALAAAYAALCPGGHLAFEVRDPGQEAWRQWTREESYRRARIEGVGVVATWVEVTDVSPPLVSFRTTFVFEADGAVLTSDSTLHFRSHDDINLSLRLAGFEVEDVRDATDRPGLELVFIASR